MPIESVRHRLEVAAGLLQYALAPMGCQLQGWYFELLIIKAFDIHRQRFDLEEPQAEVPCGQPWGELLDALAAVVAQLSEGLRGQRSEYRLIAVLYDRWDGVQDMHALQSRMNRVFEWIAADAALRKIGNDNGFKLS